MSTGAATLADIQSDFDWDVYLRSLGPKAARIAPASCFKQAANPPSNEFQPGQRLESRDPRNPDNTCIATVIECLGPRLRLRLDGSDDRNDFYRLVDSDDIFPYPTSRFLVPPLGFAKSSNYWPAFLEKVKQAGNFAPKACFRKPPPAPPKNVFSAGQKLEAVDRKNPLFVCPATVKEVRGDRLHVAFDGWRGAFDYWCRFDSRDLFPVGWCGRAGYPVQPPGSKDAARVPKPLPTPPPPPPPPPAQQQQQLNSSSSTSTPGVAKQAKKKKKKKSRKGSGDSGNVVSTRQSVSSGKPAAGRKSEAVAASTTSAAATKTASSTSAASKTKKELVTVYVNPAEANRQVFQVSRLRRLPSQFGPAPPSRLLQRLLQAAVSAAHDERRVYERVPRAAEDAAGATGANDPHHRHRHYRVRAKFGHRRHCRSLPRMADAREFWRQIGAFLASLNSEGLFAKRPGKLVGPADSSMADDSPPAQSAADVHHNDEDSDGDDAADDDDEPTEEIVDDADEETAEAMPDSSQADAAILSSAASAVTPVADYPDDVDANVVSSTAAAPKKRPSTTDGTGIGDAAAATLSNQQQQQQQQEPAAKMPRQQSSQAQQLGSAQISSSSVPASSAAPPHPAESSAAQPAPQPQNPPPPPSPPPFDMSEWTSAHVCRFLRQSESNLAHLAPVFLEHDIDGKALLLLSSDMMMKYMGVKLGPALKLLNCVEQAKRRLAAEQKQQQQRQQPGLGDGSRAVTGST